MLVRKKLKVLLCLLCGLLMACSSTPTRPPDCGEIVAHTASVALDWEEEAAQWEMRARRERVKRKHCENSCEDRIDHAWWNGLKWGVAIGSGSIVITGVVGLILIPRLDN